ncbi:MFS transporter [Peribacillus butanolivorans]|uniref:MFS transporter n=2 Tax=Peribacillus TaxID=2675229 RepID=A0AAX0S9X2_9BACI|nr:MFS transporter [Peribacillus butanolivorans]KQU27010.1 multidrug transporter [Bacillus sp. Leaf13]KRF65714.1 multidrug transporter [Bacillus sp. Soil768D1]AXN41203.1 MFS transporter [Peribacillus butanolivorans]KON69044.1 multidrug transporter [Peribacillus butanolivorans]MCO0599606.1 MFS transporter [Peribacillus butanolivorans]
MSAEQRKKIIILMINMFIAIGSFGIIIPILPAYLASINQGGTAAGLMIAIFAGAQLIFSPIAGKWTDQFGRRKMIIYGLIGLTISMFIFYAVNSIWLLYASRVVGGVGAALLVPAIFAYVADITTFDQRAKGNSLVSAAMSLGIVVGPGIGGFLADFGLKFPFLISALVSLVAVIFSIFVLKESETKQASQAMDMANNESMVRKIALSVKMPYFIPLIITLVMSFGLMAYESVIGLYLDNQFNSTPKDIATMVTATGIVSVIVQLFVVDRIVRRFGEVSVLIIFISVAAIGFLLSLFASSYLIFFGISLIIFLSTSILRPVLNTLISKMAGNEQGFAMGMNNAYMSIGNVLGPTLAGMMYDVQITYPFILGLLLLILTLMITMAWQKKSLHAKALS